MFYGRKDQYYLFWPVCGQERWVIPQTGQRKCYDTVGNEISCQGTGQDGELRYGLEWPVPRFVVRNEAVKDRLTGLYWLKDANISSGPMTWEKCFNFVKKLDLPLPEKTMQWRLPTINELESLVDCSRHSPA